MPVVRSAEPGVATAKPATKGSGHRDLIFKGGGANTELSPELVGLVSAPHVCAGLGRSEIE